MKFFRGLDSSCNYVRFILYLTSNISNYFFFPQTKCFKWRTRYITILLNPIESYFNWHDLMKWKNWVQNIQFEKEYIQDRSKLRFLSKPNVTQLNSTQLKATQKQLHWVRHNSHLEPTTTTTTIKFSVTSRSARKLKFCTDTH